MEILKMPDEPSAYDLGGSHQVIRRKAAEEVARAIVPEPVRGSSYDLGHVARITCAATKRNAIVEKLMGR